MLRVSVMITHYGHSQVLYGLNFSLIAGEVVTLLGRNAIGKTTAINSIMGIVSKTSGRIEFEGTNISFFPSKKVAKLGIGLVPESRQIFPNLSAHKNLIATAREDISQAWSAERIYYLFPELAARKNSMVNLFSGGELKMWAIGRALMTNPKLMTFDEATEGLAPLTRRKIWEALGRTRADGLAILITDKNLRDLLKLADRHNIVHRRQVVWTGASQELDSAAEIRTQYLAL